MDMIGPFLKQLVQSPNKSTTRNLMEYTTILTSFDCFKSEKNIISILDYNTFKLIINSTLGP